MGPLPKNIYEQQAANRRNTLLVVCVFILFFGFLGFGFDAFLLGFSPWTAGDDFGVPFPVATVIALAYAGFTAARSLRSGDSAVLQSACAEPVPENDPAYRQLVNVADEMSVASGIPRPKLYFITDPDPNAFTTGRDPAHASIAVTRGLVEKLTREELQGVVAHEMSHIRNNDVRLMTVVAALIGAVMLLVEFGLRTMRFGGGRKTSSSSKRSSGGAGPVLFVLWILAMVIAPLISQLLALAVSRQREYLADASGAELTRNPGALASALEKIDAADEPTRSIKKGTGHLCIADPLGRRVNEREGFLADLFATHPPVLKRITALRAMAYQGA
jgi:heat shock protein HtpX